MVRLYESKGGLDNCKYSIQYTSHFGDAFVMIYPDNSAMVATGITATFFPQHHSMDGSTVVVTSGAMYKMVGEDFMDRQIAIGRKYVKKFYEDLK